MTANARMQVRAFQVNALVRKSLTYQKKNVSTNICVLVTPIIIIGLLAAIQRLIDNANKLSAEDKVPPLLPPASSYRPAHNLELHTLHQRRPLQNLH